MAGAFLSISYLNLFVKNMSAGRGFIAIATIIFGRYSPLGVAAAGIFFGFLDALQMALQGTVNIPPEIIQSIPYCMTIIAVALASQAQHRKAL
jgi:simple sugar transport system permease protein